MILLQSVTIVEQFLIVGPLTLPRLIQLYTNSDIHGSIFLEVVLKETIKMKVKLEEIGNNQLVRRQIKQHIVKVGSRYETVLRNNQIEQLVVVMNQPQKRYNEIQNEIGSENIAFM